ADGPAKSLSRVQERLMPVAALTSRAVGASWSATAGTSQYDVLPFAWTFLGLVGLAMSVLLLRFGRLAGVGGALLLRLGRDGGLMLRRSGRAVRVGGVALELAPHVGVPVVLRPKDG